MRSKRALFWYSLGLTLLLLLPMVLVVAFLTDQYMKQQQLRQASAAETALPIERGAQDVRTVLLVVQQERPAFLLLRADGARETLTFCALPDTLLVDAPAGTTTLADCTLTAGAARAAQLLCGTLATGETACPGTALYRRHPRNMGGLRRADAAVRFDTAALLSPAARMRVGYGSDTVAACTAAQAGELIENLEGGADRGRAVQRPRGSLVGLRAAEPGAAGRHHRRTAQPQRPPFDRSSGGRVLANGRRR